jgi:hypothetical protein
VGVEDRVGMARERFGELVERGKICGGFVAIVKRIEFVDEEEKVGLWLVDAASNSLLDGVSINYLLMEEGLVIKAVMMARWCSSCPHSTSCWLLWTRSLLIAGMWRGWT